MTQNIKLIEWTNTEQLAECTFFSAEYTFFSAAHATFSKKRPILRHKASVIMYKKIEITSCILANYNGIKLEVDNKRNYRKCSQMWRKNKIQFE
jgi:hypothetical protein